MGKHALGTCSQHRSDPLGEKAGALPDENGTAYTGSAIVDKKNLLGHGKDALLFYHTAQVEKTSGPGLQENSSTLPNGYTIRQTVEKHWCGMIVF